MGVGSLRLGSHRWAGHPGVRSAGTHTRDVVEQLSCEIAALRTELLMASRIADDRSIRG